MGTAVAAAYVMNWHWEMAQMPAYRDMADKPWVETVGICAVAALGDVLMTLLAYGVGAALWRDWRWAWAGNVKVYSLLAILGIGMAVAVERVALAVGRWSYNEAMPIIPILEVGALPALQLMVLIPLSFAFANVRQRQKRKQARHLAER